MCGEVSLNHIITKFIKSGFIKVDCFSVSIIADSIDFVVETNLGHQIHFYYIWTLEKYSDWKPISLLTVIVTVQMESKKEILSSQCKEPLEAISPGPLFTDENWKLSLLWEFQFSINFFYLHFPHHKLFCKTPHKSLIPKSVLIK